MNYRHIYHAGNFADIFKHLILTNILNRLKDKDKPFAVLDTHAGIGIYDLNSKEAAKTEEYKDGIIKLLKKEKFDNNFIHYINIIKAINYKFPLIDSYPGSPYLTSNMLRENDRLIACELHPEDYVQLKDLFTDDKNVAVHNIDGYLGVKAFLPFQENRGLVFIDPPYEKNNEYENIIKYLKIAYKRFRNGIYAVWYPIKDLHSLSIFHNMIVGLRLTDYCLIDFIINADYPAESLNGCGMVLINPPWRMILDLRPSFDLLIKLFDGKHHKAKIRIYEGN